MIKVKEVRMKFLQLSRLLGPSYTLVLDYSPREGGWLIYEHTEYGLRWLYGQQRRSRSEFYNFLAEKVEEIQLSAAPC